MSGAGGGSSPHTRGAHLHPVNELLKLRIIPAYAGSTEIIVVEDLFSQDHPRIRGEHHLQTWKGWSGNGSSPHTRGARLHGENKRVSRGIIPAYAGSTATAPAAIQAATWIIPAYAGSTTRTSTTPRGRPGSSPHTRGAHGKLRLIPCGVGIIPAYAGSTCTCWRAPRRASDHPRIRGEHVAWVAACQALRGSSPHTRGALDSREDDGPTLGIIPAYAGSTPTRLRPSDCLRDHPRIRGEHRGRAHRHRRPDGSSPHTRGAHKFRYSNGAGRRIIPAYAGSTAHDPGDPSRHTDHPRIRGEHRMLGDDTPLPGGSSPHTRGALSVLTVMLTGRGIIPAYAGSTQLAERGDLTAGDHPRIRGEHPSGGR